MGNISRRTMLGATGGLIAGGLLKTQADALVVAEEAAGLQAAQADPTKMLGGPTSVIGQRAPGNSRAAAWAPPRPRLPQEPRSSSFGASSLLPIFTLSGTTPAFPPSTRNGTNS